MFPNFTTAIARNHESIVNHLGQDIPELDEALAKYHKACFIASMSDENKIMFAEQAQARKTLINFLAQFVPADKAQSIPIS